ncbi:MAG: DUF5060 domain-containing protein [Flavobacteriales bacterium]
MKYLATLIVFSIFTFQTMAQRELSYELNFNNEKGLRTLEKAEIGVKLPSLISNQVRNFIEDDRSGLNPYDPADVDLSSVWTSPSGKTQKVNGFYHEGFVNKDGEGWSAVPTKYNWLIRWSPDEVGMWSVSISLKAGGQEWYSNELTVNCSSSQPNTGYLTVNSELPNGDKFLYKHDSDLPFFAIGHNIVHGGNEELRPPHPKLHQQWLRELADAKGNFWRLELGMANFLPSGFNATNYSEKLYAFNELDKLIELSDKLGLYFIMFRHHTEMLDGPVWSKSTWGLNGYKNSFGLETREEYYTSEEVFKWQMNELRYLMARWGYAKSFSFFGYSEVNDWIDDLAKEENRGELEAMKIFATWFQKQKTYIQENLQMDRLLYANSFATSSIPDMIRKLKDSEREKYDIFLASDIAAYHSYGKGKENNLISRPNFARYFKRHWNKPSIQEESGLAFPHMYCASDENFFQTLWASCFYADFGTAMNYWWYRGLHHSHMEKHYTAVNNFMSKIDLTQTLNPVNDFNSSVRRSRISYYSLVLPDSDQAYGFLNDPSHYWRNMTAENQGLKELVFEGEMKSPCLMTDGHFIGVPLSNERLNTGNDKFKDAYTEASEITPMTAESYGSETIKIKGLERTGLFRKKNSYTITYYDPRDPNLRVIKTEKLDAKRNGKLELTLDASTWPAAAFHIKKN